ncbi:MAG: tripartite tricarboxylate transporter substrate binding protein [Burkholderiaceae bacterium]
MSSFHAETSRTHDRRRSALRALLAGMLGGSAMTASTAWGQPAGGWPSKTIRFVLPFSAGGINDILIRILIGKLSPALGQPVVVDVKTGASGVIGADAVAKSPADGYTWLASSFPLTVAPALTANLPFDPVKDLRAVAMLATAPNALVVSSELPLRSVADLVAAAKNESGGVSYASPGIGSSAHIGSETFRRLAGFSANHVQYRGAPPALVDVIAGRVTFMLVSASLATAHVRDGRLRALAVMDQRRSTDLPAVPTIAEAGFPGAQVVPWFALHVPAGTSDDIVQRLHREVSKALSDPEVVAGFTKAGASVAPAATPAQVDAQLREEVARWQALARDIQLPRQ